MPSDHEHLDLDDQLRAFAVTLEAETAEPIRPQPHRRPPANDGRTHSGQVDVRQADVADRDVAPLGPAPSSPRRRQWLLSGVAAAAVTAVVVAGLVVLSGDEDPAPPASPPSSSPSTVEPGTTAAPETTLAPETSAAPETPIAPATTSVPASATPDDAPPPEQLSAPEPGETQRTIVGDITWTLVEGDATTQPTSVQAEIDGEFFGLEADGRAWHSSDGITWELTERRPEGILRVFDFGGETFARTLSGLSRWDGETFVPVELPDSSAPDVEGLEPAGVFQAPHVELGGELVLPVSTRLAVPWRDLYGTDVWPEWDAVTETIRLRDPESNDPLPVAVLTVELVAGEPGRLEFRDAASDDLVTAVDLLPGVDPDELVRRLVLGTGLPYNELLVGDGTDFEVVPTPWHLADAPRLAALGSRLLAVVAYDPVDQSGTEPRASELWTSTDARTWTPLELPEPFGTVIDNVDIVSDGTRVLLTIVSRDGDVQRPETWSSEDGITWAPVEGAASWGGTEVTDFGWVQPLFEPGVGIRVSPDGLVWQEIPFDIGPPVGPGGGGSSVFGRTIFVSSFENGGARTLWVGKVAEG